MRTLKVVFLSDTHNQHSQVDVPDGDILIHSGDALGKGSYSEAVRFNEWLGTLPHKHKIFVPGNHDELFEMNPETARDVMTNATVLVDELIEIEGLKIYGSPWSVKFHDWSYMKLDIDLAEIWEKIPKGLDILITHSPPYGILDMNRQYHPCGSQTLLQATIAKKPRIHAFGHIHESSGVILKYGITFINAAILDDWYNTANEPKVEVIEVLQTGESSK